MQNYFVRQRARETLKESWLAAIIAVALPTVLNFYLSSKENFFGWLLSMVINGPLTLGVYAYFLLLVREQKSDLNEILYGFKHFVEALILSIMVMIFTLLWMLLLIVPGVVAAYSYSMAFYILKDNPAMPADKAMDESKKMMFGHKNELFMLDLSFLGWFLLAAVILAVGSVISIPMWLLSIVLALLLPYWLTSRTIFYEDLKQQINEENTGKKQEDFDDPFPEENFKEMEKTDEDRDQ